jgi:hypothetical protein
MILADAIYSLASEITEGIPSSPPGSLAYVLFRNQRTPLSIATCIAKAQDVAKAIDFDFQRPTVYHFATEYAILLPPEEVNMDLVRFILYVLTYGNLLALPHHIIAIHAVLFAMLVHDVPSSTSTSTSASTTMDAIADRLSGIEFDVSLCQFFCTVLDVFLNGFSFIVETSKSLQTIRDLLIRIQGILQRDLLTP